MSEDKTKLDNEMVDKELESLEGWRREGKFLKKDFVFDDFNQINTFLPHLTKTITDQNHHPDFEFVSGDKKVSVEVTTHSEGGLTKADLNLARELNNWR